MEMVETARGFALLTPRMFFFAAASGRRMTSSWSCPHELCPLRSSTPMTRNGMFRMRMICPRGSASAKRFSTVVWPSSATFVAPSTSSPPIGRPATTDQSRASKYSAVTPCTTVAQFELPYTTCSVPRTDGAAAWTVCTSRWIAHASSSEIVGRLPWPSRMPLDVTLPERTTIRFEPRLWICSATRAWAPEPTATMAITAPTPMMMPSIVRALLSLFTRSARMATRALCQTFTRRPPPHPTPAPRRRRAARRRARHAAAVRRET